ncbi:MAG: DNA primase [bacterium]|nr:DNA primase [bacterium]
MSSPTEQIKERLGIEEVVGSYIKLERAGNNLKAKCPFHNEKTPSFFVSPARNSFYCFGCGEKGDIFSFVEKFEGTDFRGALKTLAERAGVELKNESREKRDEREKLFDVLEAAAAYFESELEESEKPKEYLASRGFSSQTIKDWRVGFAKNDWRRLFEKLTAQGFLAGDIEKAGLLRRKESGGDPYDFFRGRIMFPLFDTGGRVTAFSGRILPEYDDGKTGKYVNSPDGPLFDKSSLLFGMNKAKFAIRSKKYAVAVEGQIDLILAHQAGFNNTVSASGTAFTEKHALSLKRLTENVILAYDADSAGFSAAERTVRLMFPLQFNVKIAYLPEGFDPADIIKKNPEEWKRILREAKHAVNFFLDKITSDKTLSPTSRARMMEKKVLSLIKLLPSSIEQSELLKSVAARSGIREDVLWREYEKISKPEFEGHIFAVKVQEEKNQQKYGFERKLFGILFWQKGKGPTGMDVGMFEKRASFVLGEVLFEELKKSFETVKEELVFEAENYYGENADISLVTEEILSRLELEKLKLVFTESMDDLSKAEKDKDAGKIESLLKKCQDVSKRINELSLQSHL